MLTGIELPPDRPDLTAADRAALQLIQPAAVKVRYHPPGYLKAVAALVPNARFLSRPTTEGYTEGEILDGYERAVQGFRDAGLLDRLIGHEVANEPNHTAGPYGDALGWRRYEEVLVSVVRRIGAPAIPLISPGLQPYHETEVWASMFSWFSWFWAYRGAHAYWEGEHVADALANVHAQTDGAPGDRIVVTEFNDASKDDSQDVRVDRCIQAVARMHAEGFSAACLFILRAPGWESYVYPVEPVRRILTAVPVTRSAPASGVNQSQGGQTMAYQIGPGIAAKMQEQQDTPRSDERWVGDVFSIAAGDKGLYIYVKQANRTYFLPAR